MRPAASLLPVVVLLSNTDVSPDIRRGDGVTALRLTRHPVLTGERGRRDLPITY